MKAAGTDPVHVWAPTNYWTAITFLPPSQGGNSGQIFDNINDEQTNDPAADFVGTATIAGMYLGFNDFQDLSPTSGMLSFRFRMGDMHAQGTYSSVVFVGIDGNSDGRIDMFVGYDGRGGVSSRGVRYWAADCTKANCNTSPSTTGRGNELGTLELTSPSNHHYALVSNVLDPGITNTNLDGAGSGPDAFLSFGADFDRIVSGLAAAGITGVTDTTIMRFIAITSQNPNSFNQDLGGCAVVNGTATWTQCGSTAGYAPRDLLTTPEPGTYMLCGLGLVTVAIARRRMKKI